MNLESILLDDNYFQIIKSDSGKVWAYTDSPKFILIPEDFYSPDLRKQYFRVAHELSFDEVIFENTKIADKYRFLFALKQNIKNKIERKFPTAVFSHYAPVLSAQILALSQNKPVVLVNRQKHHFFLLISNHGELCLLNSFNYNHDNDISYFTLNALRNSGIEINQATIWYSGLTKKNDASIEILRNYVPKAEILPDEGIEQNIDPEFKYFRFNQVIF